MKKCLITLVLTLAPSLALAQSPANPFNPPTFSGTVPPPLCSNGSLFFNSSSLLWYSCGPNNIWAILNTTLLPNTYGFINIRNSPFNAVGNGIADDTQAILTAESAAEITNGILYIPCGIYNFSSEITISNRISLIGAGFGQGSSLSKPCVILKKITDIIGIHVKSNVAHVILQGFELTSTVNTGTSDGIVIGDIDTGSSDENEIRDVVVTGQKGNGVNIRNGNLGVMDHVILTTNGIHGLLLNSQNTGAVNANAWRVYNITSVGNVLDGIRFDEAPDTSAYGLDAEGNGRYGIYCNYSGMHIDGHSEGNTGSNVVNGSSCFGSVIEVSNPQHTWIQGAPFSYMRELGGGFGPYQNPTNGFFGFQAGTVYPAPIVLTYSASIALNNTVANDFTITPLDGNAFTIQAPSGATGLGAQYIRVTVINTSGGVLGTATWTAGNFGFRMATWTQPANGFSRTITFRFDAAVGSLTARWTEVSRSTADIPN